MIAGIMQPAASELSTEPIFEVPPELANIADLVRKGEIPRATVRTLLSWFRFQRRGFFVVYGIRSCLNSLRIQTEPDFEAAWIDASITFVPLNTTFNALPAAQVDNSIAISDVPEIITEPKP